MPRGGSKHGNNSPLIGDNGVLATPDELNALTHNMLQNFLADIERGPVDLKNESDVINAVTGYFIDCEQSGKRPGNMGLYRALGVSRQDVSKILAGQLDRRVTPVTKDILKKAIRLLGEYREQLGAQGKLNPVTMIFWQKNYDGLQDTQQIEVSATPGPEAKLSPEEIAKQIEKDIPIDTEYRDIENSNN